MKVSKNSWHYRILSKMDMLPNEPSLCPYFRNLIISLLFIIVASVAAMGVLGIMLSPIVHFLSIATIGNDILVVAGLLWFVAIGTLSLFWVFENAFCRDKKNKEPTAIGRWVKAKKDKICPIIKFED